jgi:hypothetical protein
MAKIKESLKRYGVYLIYVTLLSGLYTSVVNGYYRTTGGITILLLGFIFRQKVARIVKGKYRDEMKVNK